MLKLRFGRVFRHEFSEERGYECLCGLRLLERYAAVAVDVRDFEGLVDDIFEACPFDLLVVDVDFSEAAEVEHRRHEGTHFRLVDATALVRIQQLEVVLRRVLRSHQRRAPQQNHPPHHLRAVGALSLKRGDKS